MNWIALLGWLLVWWYRKEYLWAISNLWNVHRTLEVVNDDNIALKKRLAQYEKLR